MVLVVGNGEVEEVDHRGQLVTITMMVKPLQSFYVILVEICVQTVIDSFIFIGEQDTTLDRCSKKKRKQSR